MNTNWNGFITFFGTSDLQKTEHFYKDLLGLSLYKDQGVCRIYSISDSAKIGFCSHMKNVADEMSPIITLLTDDVDGVYKSLIEAEYCVPEEPKVNPKYNIYHFFIKDPNGYTVEVQKFLD